jgi:hypothetical protein
MILGDSGGSIIHQQNLLLTAFAPGKGSDQRTRSIWSQSGTRVDVYPAEQMLVTAAGVALPWLVIK